MNTTNPGSPITSIPKRIGRILAIGYVLSMIPLLIYGVVRFANEFVPQANQGHD